MSPCLFASCLFVSLLYQSRAGKRGIAPHMHCRGVHCMRLKKKGSPFSLTRSSIHLCIMILVGNRQKQISPF
ncbi:hypothetical protein BGZ63DRAFT_381156 [Mariannaea sp. PMI_226]|nr:hypothetical protein BGZ63DRAFT_381156 [Mariannaea sp. PMI_226]